MSECQHQSDLQWAQDILSRDADAAERLHAETAGIRRILISRGASAPDAEDVSSEIIERCFAPKRNILISYKGQGALIAYLTTAAARRLIDIQRQRKTRKTVVASSLDSGAPSEAHPFDTAEDSNACDHDSEDAVIDIIRDAIQEALSRVEPLHLLYLRLVYCHGVTKRDLALISHCHESTVGRDLNQTIAEVRNVILEEVKASDPGLSVTWEDFLDLCQGSIDIFGRAPSEK